MKKKMLLIMALALIMAMCTTVPLTGRKGLALINSNELNQMSFQQYEKLKQEQVLSSDRAKVQMINKVGLRIQNAVTQFLKDNGYAEVLDGFAWEFILIEDPAVNAFCMPGGKVAFYTGILPYCKDENGIAVVMGHEVAHAIAQHGNERMSQAMLQQLGGVALNVALAEKPEQTQTLFNQAYGLSTQLGLLLPFSRKHESEADKLGLYFMAMAGYDPQAAPEFWQRMRQSGGQKPPELLSTHPSDETRIANLNTHMPQALIYYNQSKKQ